MSAAIRISDEVYQDARKIASAEFRSVPQQVELWARVGKCALENPDLPIEFIRELISTKNQDRSLAEPFIVAGNPTEKKHAQCHH